MQALIASLEQFHDAWCATPPPPQGNILRVLRAHDPAAGDRADLAMTSGQSATSRGDAHKLDAVRSLGLIDDPPARRGGRQGSPLLLS